MRKVKRLKKKWNIKIGRFLNCRFIHYSVGGEDAAHVSQPQLASPPTSDNYISAIIK